MSRDTFSYRGSRIPYIIEDEPDPMAIVRGAGDIATRATRAARTMDRPNADEVSMAEIGRDLGNMAGLDVDSLARAHPVAAATLDQMRYSPSALGMAAIPFSDEIMGATEAALDPNVDYGDAARRMSEYRAQQESMNPGSAMLGYLGQGIVAGPFMPGAPPVGNMGVMRAVVSAIPRLAAEGAVLGGIQGLDRTEGRPFAEAMQYNPGADFLPQAQRFGQQAGQMARDTARDASIGAAMNVGIGSVVNAAGQGIRNALRPNELAPAREAFDSAIGSHPSIDEGLIDDIAIRPENVVIPEIAGEARAAAPAAEAARSAMGQNVSGLTVDDILGEGLRANPDLERLRAGGLLDRNQIRGAHNTFGVPGLSERMDRYGILGQGETIGTPQVIARAGRVRDLAGQAIERVRRSADDTFIDAETLTRRLQSIADEYRNTPDPDTHAIADEIERRIGMINGLGAGDAVVDPATNTVVDRLGSEIVDPATGVSEPLNFLGFDELQSLVNAQRGRNASVYNGSISGNIPEARRAGLASYRALNETRDDLAREALGEAGLADYRLARDAYATGSTFAPSGRLPAQNLTSPTLSRRLMMGSGASTGATIGFGLGGPPGAAAGSAVGAVVGYGVGSQIRNREHAILAAINAPGRGSLSEVGSRVIRGLGNEIRSGASAEPLATDAIARLRSIGIEAAPEQASAILAEADQIQGRIPEIMRRIGAAIEANPTIAGQYQSILTASARRGTLQAALAAISRRDPQMVSNLVNNIGLQEPDRPFAQTAEDADLATEPSTDEGDSWARAAEDADLAEDDEETPPRPRR